MWIVRGAILLLLAAVSCGFTHTRGVSSLQPSDATIPVSSLATGDYAANFWAGITSPASTIATSSGLKYITPTTFSTSLTMATGTGMWRDQQITSYIARGEFTIRLSGGNGLYLSIGISCVGCVRMGVITGFSTSDPEGTGTRYAAYVQDTPAACITNWPSDGNHTITFGARGFNVYMLIDGVQAIDTCQTPVLNPTGAINYYEYRPEALGAGQASVWLNGGPGARDITINYFSPTTLYSNYLAKTFDPRDFGWRDIAAVTGSMTAASCTLTLSAARDIRVNDQVIVEIGGESGAGARNTIGVGGVSPSLHYTNITALNADTGKANGTLAYLDTTGVVYQSSSGVWAAYNFLPYYTSLKNPLSLVSRVTAVNAAPATSLTLADCAAVSTTAANVYLDVSSALYPATTNPAEVFQAGRSDGYEAYTGMTINLPTGTMYGGNKGGTIVAAKGSSNYRENFTIQGAGRTSTTYRSAKGTPNGMITSTLNDGTTAKDFTHIGNLGANGFGYQINAAGQFSGSVGIGLALWGTNANVLNVGTTDEFGGGMTLTGVNPTIDGHVVEMTVVQKAYLGWQSQLSNCTGGIIKNSTATSPFLVKVWEHFACNGSEIRDVTGTNALMATNSSTSVTFTRPSTTITADSYDNEGNGGIDEPILSLNNNAFGSGNTITVVDPRIIQSGYVRTSDSSSLKAIQVLQSNITDVTITGSFPGGGGCSTALGGLLCRCA